MPTGKRMDEARLRGWLVPALIAVGLVTAFRIIALSFDKTDLFVDEAQYWLWGQNLDLGYYSKPPLIAWVIRAVTDLAGSDAAFWVRLPAPLFHAATALILAAFAARAFGARAAFWVALCYATLPFTAVGSALISTDTILAPFFAAALLFHLRLIETGRAPFALLVGVSVGLAFLAKYAAIYFLLGVGLAAMIWPIARVTWRNGAVMLIAFGIVISPNVVWNLTHGLTTVEHTMDNIGWVRDATPFAGLDPAGLAEFFASQFAVFGPILFGGLIWVALRRPTETKTWLLAFSLPILAIVCVQALLSKAYANWAVTAYFAGTLLVVPVLLTQAPSLLRVSVVLNGLVCLAVPIATVFAPDLTLGRDKPLLSRYLGRADLSREIIAKAKWQGVDTVVAADRDVLADLAYTGRDSGLAFRAMPPEGRPRNFYEQTMALANDAPRPVLAVLSDPPICQGKRASAVARFDTEGGAYAGRKYAAFVVGPDCLRTKG